MTLPEQTIKHIQIIHERAAGCPGKLKIASFGENPTTGEAIKPKVSTFAVGDTDAMARFINQIKNDKHRNIYIPLATFRQDLKPTAKGGIKDIECVFGLCGDFDDDRACEYLTRMPINSNYVLETSTGRFQCMVFPDKPLTVAEAQPVAEYIQKESDCDSGTRDVGHVWRVPGLDNCPNKNKVEAGRPEKPQLVNVVQPWTGATFNPDDLGLEPAPELDLNPSIKSVKKKLIVNKMAEAPTDLIMLFVENEPYFKDLWEKKPKKRDDSASGYDFALCKMAIQFEATDQECVDLMIAFSRKHDLEIKTPNYYARTVVNARKSVEQYQAAEAIETETLLKGTSYETEDATQKALEALSKTLKARIERIERFVGDNLYYRFRIKRNIHAKINSTQELLSQYRFQARWAEQVKVVIPKVSQAKWEKTVQTIINCCEDNLTDPEASSDTRIIIWLREYLLGSEVILTYDLWEHRHRPGDFVLPFVNDNFLFIKNESFRRWAYHNKEFLGKAEQLAQEMRNIGAESKPFNIKIYDRWGEGRVERRTTGNFWKIPHEIAHPDKLSELLL